MPQLDLAPWFAILVFSWLVFLVTIPPKVLALELTPEPSAQDAEPRKMTPWIWHAL